MSSDAASPTVVEEQQTSTEITEEAEGLFLLVIPSWDGSQAPTSTFTPSFMQNCCITSAHVLTWGFPPKITTQLIGWHNLCLSLVDLGHSCDNHLLALCTE